MIFGEVISDAALPLYKLLGGGSSQLKTDITISVDNIDKMLSDCQKALTQGFFITLLFQPNWFLI